MEKPDDKLVTIATGYGLAETAVTSSFLQAYGIPTIAIPSQSASIFWHYTVAFGGIEIRVAARQLVEAQMLLDSVEQSSETRDAKKSQQLWRGIAAVLVFFFFRFHRLPKASSEPALSRRMAE
ncbi:hypothetical protein [Agrobacterium sp. NCPPB 925]|uniref:hypothetical protein n=1 Tax=Agrobacterium sp. NCPPB 925 TaxID=1631629 RepID=UPI0009C4CC29|nr:hypothetical protein [Agrobacterium sp. NCPPB 925]CUX21054.1 conserved hypothetical protein [Agrobacterium sp. NCPPB 925]